MSLLLGFGSRLVVTSLSAVSQAACCLGVFAHSPDELSAFELRGGMSAYRGLARLLASGSFVLCSSAKGSAPTASGPFLRHLVAVTPGLNGAMPSTGGAS